MADETYRLNPALAESTLTDQPDNKTEDSRWQQRLLPLMVGMIIALTIFFFVVTLGQLLFLQWNISNSPPLEIDPAVSATLLNTDMGFEELFQLRQYEVLAAMERYTTEKRYHHAGVMIMSALWLRYLGFVTGMILALIGATFILGKLREPEQEVEGQFSQITMSLRTTSPGIILAVLGVILMFTTLVDKDDFGVTDGSVYLPVEGQTAEWLEQSKAVDDLLTLPEIPDLEEADILTNP